MTGPDPLAEARRQRGNALETFNQLVEGWDEALSVQRVQGLHGHTFRMCDEYCESVLLLGQGSWRLDGDLAAARDWFRRVGAVDGVRGEALRALAGDASQRQMWAGLLSALVLRLLDGDADNTRAWCATLDESAFWPPEALNVNQRPHAALARAMVRLLSGREPADLAPPSLRATNLRQDDTTGLACLLGAVANGRFDEVPARLQARAAHFRERARSRETAINAWGWGKPAQAMVFDAWGTAIARIGSWKGMPAPPDTPEHPRVFLA